MSGRMSMIFSALFLVPLLAEASHIPKLVNDLFRDGDYNKYAQPWKPLKVGLRIQLEEIKEIDDVREILVSRFRTNMWWSDSRLKWNRTQYKDEISIMVPQSLVWKPDIALLNGVKDVETIGNHYTPVLLHYRNGQSQWSPVNIFETKCHFDLEYYPYDTQKCEIHIGTIASSSFHIVLQNLQCKEPEHEIETSTWRLVKIEKSVRENVVSDETKRRQEVLVCTYFLQRKSLYYFTNILLPLIFLGILNPLAFFIPYDSGERISFSMTLFLTFAVFVTIMMDKVPVNSEKTSFLQLYLICQLAITVFILVFTAIRVRLLNMGSKSHKPNMVAPEILTISGNLNAWEKPAKVDELEEQKRRSLCACLNGCLKMVRQRMDFCAFLFAFVLQIICNVWFFTSVTVGSTV